MKIKKFKNRYIIMIALVLIAVIFSGINFKKDIQVKENILLVGGNGSEKKLSIEIQQVDVSEYPTVKLYAQISDVNKKVPKLENPFFFVRKEDANAKYIDQKIKKISQLDDMESLNVDIVADTSGSMSGDPISEAQIIMCDFVSSMQFSAGDLVELTSFNSDVYIEEEFTNSSQSLINKINSLDTNGSTSLYDALYTAVTRVVEQSGAKCVIAFTDGIDNKSSYTIQQVIDIANKYHIPIFIIGIGDNEYSEIGRIATETGGEYYGIENVLSMDEIYKKIYKHQKELYMIEFEDTDGNLQNEVNILVGYNSPDYIGEINFYYTPDTLLNLPGESVNEGAEKVVEDYICAFDDAMNNMDFSYISNYLKQGSNIYNSQKKYVQTDVSMILESYEIISTEYINNDSCVVTTRETFYAERENGPYESITQKCKYIVERENNVWKMVDFADSVIIESEVVVDEGPEKVVEGYICNFDDAMNNIDFSYISSYLKQGSNIYNAQKNYIQTNVEMTLDSYVIVSTDYINSDSCVVTTRESYYAENEYGTFELMTQECKYLVEREYNEWKMVDFADSVKLIN